MGEGAFIPPITSPVRGRRSLWDGGGPGHQATSSAFIFLSTIVLVFT